MAIIEQKTPHEFLARWDDAGNLQGAHIGYRIAFLDDATGAEVTSKFGNPEPVDLGNAPLLTQISEQINQAALADGTEKAAQIAQLTADHDVAVQAKSDAESVRDAALAQVAELQAQLAAYQTPVDENGVPKSVSRKQGRAALILAGLLDRVQPVIDSIEDLVQRALTQNAWDSAQTFDRADPFLSGLATALGLSDADLDNLFKQAATL